MATSFTQEAVNESSDTDRILTKFDITVTCIINTAYQNFLLPGLLIPQSLTPTQIAAYIHTQLLQKRRTLSFKFDGKELIPQTQTGITGTVDAKNGPNPVSCSYSQLTSTTFLMTYHIVAHYWTTNTITSLVNFTTVNNPGNAVLYNRWTETVDIDNCMYTTRTRSGKFQIRSDNTQGFIADQLRSQFAVTGVPAGFLRESANYTVSEDGLTISYRIVDKEQFKMPPSPAFDATGTYEESCHRLGVKRYGNCRVTLKGAKTTPQADLITACIAIVREKVRIALVPQANPGPVQIAQQLGLNAIFAPIVESFELSVGMYTNDVTCSYRAMFRNSQLFNPGGLTGNRFTVTPGSQQGINEFTPDYKDRGTASVLLQAAAYFDPSLPGNELAQQGNQATDDNQDTIPGYVQMMQGLIPGQAGKRKET